MNEQEARKLYESEKEFPVRSRIFKHNVNGNYETQIPIMDICNYEEINF